MVEVITGKDADAAWAKLEGWLAHKRWTPDEAAALLAGHYPDSKILEFVPNGRPLAWKGKSAREVVVLAGNLRRSLLAHLRLLSSPKRELKSMSPTRWLELAIQARRVPRWLSPSRMHPRLARYLPPVTQLQPKISLAGNGPPTGRVPKKRRGSASDENRSTVGRSDARAARMRPLDRGSIHEWAYIDPKAVERILAAPGARREIAVPEEQGEALRLTLRDITFELLHHSFGRKPLAEEVKQVRQSYEGFVHSVEALRGLDYPAPLPPAEWRTGLLRWLEEEEKTLSARKRGGAPVKKWDRIAYPRLLGFYELAFGYPAASTTPGPTARFVHSYLKEVRGSLAKTNFKIPEEKSLILQIWKVPNLAGLASKIRAAKPNAVAKMHIDQHKAAREAREKAHIGKTSSN